MREPPDRSSSPNVHEKRRKKRKKKEKGKKGKREKNLGTGASGQEGDDPSQGVRRGSQILDLWVESRVL